MYRTDGQFSFWEKWSPDPFNPAKCWVLWSPDPFSPGKWWGTVEPIQSSKMLGKKWSPVPFNPAKCWEKWSPVPFDPENAGKVEPSSIQQNTWNSGAQSHSIQRNSGPQFHAVNPAKCWEQWSPIQQDVGKSGAQFHSFQQNAGDSRAQFHSIPTG